MRGTIAERFWAKVGKSGDCWEWTAGRHHQWQYGHFSIGRRCVQAHRVSWELHYGPIPDGILVCHTCDNPPCVNPAHLFLGTAEDNAQDRDAKARGRGGMRNAQKTHCPHGHEYTPENTRVYHNKRGWTMRFCIECDRAFCRDRYRRNPAASVEGSTRRAREARAADPEGFRRKQRDYMRAHRKREREKRDASGICLPPRRYPLRERTHCAAGHEYTPENTRMIGNKRQCRACVRGYAAAARERKSA